MSAMSRDNLRSIELNYSARTHVGLVRPRCEDAVVIGQWIGVSHGVHLNEIRTLTGSDRMGFAAVDGMGGHAGGAEAAALVATGLPHIQGVVPEAIGEELERLSDRVSAAGAAWQMPEMGATFAMMVVSLEGIEVMNLGDCRIARFVSGAVGELTLEDRAPNPFLLGSTVVTQALGGPAIALDPHYLQIPHARGSTRFLLTSDGVHHEVQPDVVRGILSSGSASQAADALVEATLEAGAPDNLTVIVVDVLVREDPAS